MSATIPSVSATAAKAFDSEDSRCSICQEEFDTGDEPEIPLTLSCGHVLGSMCLSRWLHVPDRKHGCPICRKTLFRAREELDDEYEEGEIDDEDDQEDEGLEEGEIYDDDDDEDVDMLLQQEGLHSASTADFHHNDRPSGSPPRNDDELFREMFRIFGHWPSTTAVIVMLRSPTITRNPALVIESILQNDFALLLLRPTTSYRQGSAHLYNRISTALTTASNWLSTRPTYNTHAIFLLHHHLHLSLLSTAADFRARDRTHLINLLKAGVFNSPRINASFPLRLIIAEGISKDLLPFGDGDNPASVHMHRVLDAMPNLCKTYEDINLAERRDPSHIAEYDFKVVWEADMALAGSGLGGRRSWDLMSQPTTTTAAGSRELSSISGSVDRTLSRAGSMRGMQPGSARLASAAGWGAASELLHGDGGEDAASEQDTESISRRIDRTLGRARELVREMITRETPADEGVTAPGDIDSRRGRDGRRGRGRGHRGGSGRD